MPVPVPVPVFMLEEVLEFESAEEAEVETEKTGSSPDPASEMVVEVAGPSNEESLAEGDGAGANLKTSSRISSSNRLSTNPSLPITIMSPRWTFTVHRPASRRGSSHSTSDGVGVGGALGFSVEEDEVVEEEGAGEEEAAPFGPVPGLASFNSTPALLGTPGSSSTSSPGPESSASLCTDAANAAAAVRTLSAVDPIMPS